MPLEVDGVVITEVKIDGVTMDKVEIDGVEVFSGGVVIYDFNNATSNFGLFGSAVSLPIGAAIQFTFRSRVSLNTNDSGFFFNDTVNTIGFEVAADMEVTITGGTATINGAPIVSGNFLPQGGADYVIQFITTVAAEIDEIGRSVNGSLGCGFAVYDLIVQPITLDHRWDMHDDLNVFLPSVGAITIPIQGYEAARWIPL